MASDISHPMPTDRARAWIAAAEAIGSKTKLEADAQLAKVDADNAAWSVGVEDDLT